MKRTAAIILILLVSTTALTAQSGKTKYEFGLNLGFMVYQGDLTEGRLGGLRTQKLFFDLHATRLLGSAFSLRANLAVGKLRGDDSKFEKPEYQRHRNFNFTSPVYELSARLLWDPTGNNYGIRGLAPYVFAGAGISFLDIKRDWSQMDKDYFVINAPVLTQLPVDSAHTVPSSIPVVPVGAGIKYFIAPNWALNGEFAYRITSTDYLDGFSKTSNPKYRDSYFTYSVGIIYRPGKRDPLSCSTPRY